MTNFEKYWAGSITQSVAFDQAVALARKTVGEVPRARLWNMLSTRVRNGREITDFSTMALVASVVGKRDAAEFVATVQKVWRNK